MITTEAPVFKENEDLLGYYPFAEKIKNIIQGYASNPEPLTIGIYGKWGSGKTSLLNFIERHIELFDKEKEDKRYIKMHYNPWTYQNKEEMLLDFFDILGRKLTYGKTDNLKKAGKLITKYGKYLKSIKLSASGGIPKVFNAGVSIEPYEILKVLGEDLEGKNVSLEDVKDSINQELQKSDKKIIIFIDDVDRLDKEELFTLFKIIKTIGDFKNLVFIICMDDDYVAKAIHSRYGKNVQSGREFLEKIINVPLELPLIEKDDLDAYVYTKLKAVLDQSLIEESHLRELHKSVDGSFFKSPREVIRVINSFAISFFAIGTEVNVHDLFWIEYLKVKHKKAYNVIKDYAYDFQANQFFELRISLNKGFMEKGEKDNVSGVRKKLADKHPKVMRIIEFLFPSGKTETFSAYSAQPLVDTGLLDLSKRITHINHFEKYFSFHTKNKVSELQFLKFTKLLYEDNTDEALIEFKSILNGCREIKLVNRTRAEIETVDIENFKKLALFLSQNTDVFQEMGLRETNAITIVTSLAVRIKNEGVSDFEELVKSLIQILDTGSIISFLDMLMYNNNSPFKAEFQKLYIQKITKGTPKEPFYLNRPYSIMTMEIWASFDKEGLKDYLYKSFEVKENLVAFFRCFLSYWNNEMFGVFSEASYKRIIVDFELDSKILNGKINKHFPDITSIEEMDYNWDDYVNHSIEETLAQYFYWSSKTSDK